MIMITLPTSSIWARSLLLSSSSILPTSMAVASAPAAAVAGFRRRRAARAPCLRAPAAGRGPGAVAPAPGRRQPVRVHRDAARVVGEPLRAITRRWLAPHISLGKIGLVLDNQDELEVEIENLYGVSKGARGHAPTPSNQGGMKELYRDTVGLHAVSAGEA